MINLRLKRKIVSGLTWISLFMVAALIQVHIGRAAAAARRSEKMPVFELDATPSYVNRAGPGAQSAAGIALSPGQAGQYLDIPEGGNFGVVVLPRSSLRILRRFDERSVTASDLGGIQHIALDPKGNTYAGTVAPDARIQGFIFKGISNEPPANAVEGEQLAGQTGAAIAGGGRAPQPLSTELYDEWTLAQISTPGNLGNFGNHTASVQHRAPGSAAEVHAGYSHVLIFTSGSGTFVVGGQIVDGPGGTKIIQGGESHKIVLGEVWHIPANVPHQVVADPGGPGVNYFHANINVSPANAVEGEQLAGQTGAAIAGGGRAPRPLSTELYDEWTLAQISTPGNLGNFGNHTASVQHRAPGSAAEVHTGYSHVLIFTSGSGTFIVGGQIVDGPGGTKIIQGGESRKIVLGEVWHIPANVPHQVVADPGGPGVNYFHANINVPPASGVVGAP